MELRHLRRHISGDVFANVDIMEATAAKWGLGGEDGPEAAGVLS